MTTVPVPHVTVAERMGDGVFIEFADGENALFPASFLYAHKPWFEIDSLSDLDAVPH